MGGMAAALILLMINTRVQEGAKKIFLLVAKRTFLALLSAISLITLVHKAKDDKLGAKSLCGVGRNGDGAVFEKSSCLGFLLLLKTLMGYCMSDAQDKD